MCRSTAESRKWRVGTAERNGNLPREFASGAELSRASSYAEGAKARPGASAANGRTASGQEASSCPTGHRRRAARRDGRMRLSGCGGAGGEVSGGDAGRIGERPGGAHPFGFAQGRPPAQVRWCGCAMPSPHSARGGQALGRARSQWFTRSGGRRGLSGQPLLHPAPHPTDVPGTHSAGPPARAGRRGARGNGRRGSVIPPYRTTTADSGLGRRHAPALRGRPAGMQPTTSPPYRTASARQRPQQETRSCPTGTARAGAARGGVWRGGRGGGGSGRGSRQLF